MDTSYTGWNDHVAVRVVSQSTRARIKQHCKVRNLSSNMLTKKLLKSRLLPYRIVSLSIITEAT